MNRLSGYGRVLFACVLVAFLARADAAAPAAAAKKEIGVEILLDTDETVLGQEFEYPAGRARITTVLLTVPPHGTIPFHHHPVPLMGYIIQGELAVEYPDVGVIHYRAGDAFVEAFDTPHSGFNAGRGVVKILAVYAGAEGVPNSVDGE
ncbi:cupin domain-containing protein [Elongatibacter sediminis]|uniref:Cupin domain-containing protein n=1 Tax=Elongatibacter sediminis TaxID=3119006 RepID=A0AAW9RD46_9GAMM